MARSRGHRGFGAVLAAAAMVAVAVVTAFAQDAPVVDMTGRIAFDATNCCDFSTQVYTVSPSGGRVTWIYDAGSDPDISPDGTRIAFTDDRIEISRMDGSHMHAITRPGRGRYDTQPAWSPDGLSIAFTRCARCDSNRPRTTIWVASRTGKDAHALGSGSGPAWGPAGRIAFARGGDIYTMDPTGRDVIQITSGREEDSEPNWAPDGSRLAFTRSTRKSSTIYTIPTTGGLPEQVSVGRGPAWAPSFSPDGRMIVFARRGDLTVTSLDGTSTRLVKTDCRAKEGCGVLSTDWGPVRAGAVRR